MSQLIALIIAIALGAIVTAIGFVFLGDAFTKNSERGVALQLVSQASQVEMAMTAHRAEKAKTAFLTNFTTSMTGAAGLVTLNYLKDTVVAPQGAYSLVQDANSNVYLVASGTSTSGVALSGNVCLEVEKLGGSSITQTSALTTLAATAFTTPTGPEVALGLVTGKAYGCFKNAANDAYVFAYEVE